MMEKIGNKILMWAAVLRLITGGLGGAWAAVDRFLTLESRVAANTSTLQQDQWINLNRLKANGVALTKEQWTRWCRWGLRYRFIRNCGTWNPKGDRPRPRRRSR